MIGKRWKRPPEGLSIHINVRYACGHTIKKDVTDIVILDLPRDVGQQRQEVLEAWTEETVDSGYMCPSCAATDFWRDVPDAPKDSE